MYRLITIIFILGVLLPAMTGAQQRQQSKFKMVTVAAKVVDDQSVPISGAEIVVGEGRVQMETGADGLASFQAYPSDQITVTALGFEKLIFPVSSLSNEQIIRLDKAKHTWGVNNLVALPFLNLAKRNTTGSAATINGELLEKYPSVDLRNALTGLVTGLHVIEKNGSPGMSAEEENGEYGITEKIGVTSRGYNMTYIVDGVPVDITEIQLDPGEVESVTVIKDIVGKAMFGPVGAGGIINIKTKRGKSNERVLSFNIENGVSMIDRFPGWASGADYARLNNQARIGSDLAPNYDNSDIAAYARNDPYDMYHPSVDYRKMMLNNSKTFRRANITASGGNENVQYSAYVGYNGEGDIFKIGPVADYNRLNSRANMDIRINDRLNVAFDIFAGLSFRRSPNYGYETGETGSLTDLIEFNTAIGDIISTPPIEFPVYANNDPELEKPWYAVSSIYTTNPVGNLVENGFYTEKGRNGSASITLNYDLAGLVKGLSSKTFGAYNGLNLVRLGQANNYIAYTVTPGVNPSTGNDTIFLAKVHDGVDNADLFNLHDYYYHRFTIYERFMYDKAFGKNRVMSTLTYFLNKVTRNEYREPERQQNLIWTGMYSFNQKYTLQGVLNYSGSTSLEKGNRYGVFPSVGAGWVISEEKFMSGVKAINYLKIRAEAGVIGYESFMSPYLYREKWTGGTGVSFGPSSLTTRWFGTTTEGSVYTTALERASNADLRLERRKEFSIGLDALAVNEKLWFEATYYNNLRDGIISNSSNQIPGIVGVTGSFPYYNYNKVRYYGLEVGISYNGKAGDLRYTLGANATVQNSKLVKYDEPLYRNAYQVHTGQPEDTYWGQTYIGKFASDAETLEVPQLYDAELKKGDLKYKDMNNDGFIDDNDMSAIGHTTPRLCYALNINLSYKNFDFTAIGTGMAFYDIPLTNKYFWSGWGDNNYSDFVRDNIGGAYPRLTYYKVNNNFIKSGFWLAKGGYFKLQNVELAYNVPKDKLGAIKIHGLRLYVRGANLLTVSKVKDVDPESINSGVTVYPLFTTFSGGIKLIF
ncbi:MAG: SusC/RagA family TonB-linked outer membrane protein [Mangrovibacterium sp.]